MFKLRVGRTAKNATWIIACKIAQSIINLIISMITARYLGPSNFGLISYASSVVSFVIPIMQLGLSKTLVQELIERPEEEGSVLGTSLVLNVISAFACMIGVLGFLLIANAGETLTIIIGMLLSLSLVFQATEILQYWFQAKLLSKYFSIASLIAYAIVAVYKVFLLVTQKPVTWFAISNSLDYFLISIILLIVYKKLGNQRLSISFKLGKEMLNRSKYYIIASMMVTIFSQTDRIMLNLMVGESETGYYSAAITCIGSTAFVFTAIIDSMRPSILEEKKRISSNYENRIIQLYSVITYLALAQSLIMTLFAKQFILILFGSDYLASINPLRISVWYVTFSYYGSVRNIWILAESKQKHLWIINLSGALVNIILNAVLIPFFGANGAAIASLVTQIFTNIIVGYIIKPIKYSNKLMLKGLSPKPLLIFAKSIIVKPNHK